jgi:hypothetical protein
MACQPLTRFHYCGLLIYLSTSLLWASYISIYLSASLLWTSYLSIHISIYFSTLDILYIHPSIHPMNMATLAIFQAWIWVRVGIGKFLFVCVLQTFSPRKLHVLGACLHLADYLYHCIPIMDWIL